MDGIQYVLVTDTTFIDQKGAINPHIAVYTFEQLARYCVVVIGKYRELDNDGKDRTGYNVCYNVGASLLQRRSLLRQA
jgi:hypothetical protein